MMKLRTIAAAVIALGCVGAAQAQVASATKPALANIKGGPWTLSQGPASNAHPYLNYCVGGVQASNPGTAPMQPYYFPHIESYGNYLRGWFDYRPRNAQEAVVVALSRDHGQTWVYQQEAGALTTACPASATDSNNASVVVNGVTAVDEVFDNGQGHAFDLTVANGNSFLYTLDRSTGNIDSAGLLVHQLVSQVKPLNGVPAVESMINVGGLIYGTAAAEGLVPVSATAPRTVGLINPDAILGEVPNYTPPGYTGTTPVTTVIYVSKTLNGDTVLPTSEQCGSTPSFAVSAGRAANHDYVQQRIAYTSDGIHFTDIGAISGLSDPTSTAYDGIRYLGSGSVFPLADASGDYNGNYGIVFGAGNCLDGDSDGFHFVGYAETVGGDLTQWHVLNGLNNPILSTGQIKDPSTGEVYPANTPLADATDWPTPGATNFYYGRAYGPTAAYVDPHTLTVIFAGYNTPQPKNNLGNYRSIGVTTITLPNSTFVHPF